MKMWLTAAFLSLVFVAAPARAQGGPNADLVSQLATALGSTPDQAAGAAGAIFSLAKSNLPGDTWLKVEKAVPGAKELMQAVPGRVGVDTAKPLPVDTTFGGRGGTSITGVFKRLGLSPDQVPKAGSVVSDYVSKTAGPDVGKAFAQALH